MLSRRTLATHADLKYASADLMPVTPRYRPAPRITTLGEGFYDPVDAARFPQTIPRFRNQRWAARVGLDGLDAVEWRRHFALFDPLPGNLVEPLALRYHGHQFGVYNPQLGDGRGFLAAQLLDCNDGRLLDLGTKGSGRTPWSRGGDGRLTLKGGVREVLATEMLEALGVYTSKTFSLFETGEPLNRGDEPSPTRSSVLVRLSHSHIRFGSFQRHASRDDTERLQRLLDYSVENYYPQLASAGNAPIGIPAAFLAEVSRRSAAMCAEWMVAGFVHGVLNTDNMNITGESFDYGPYRFLPEYDPSFVAAYFDEGGLYAFGRQPERVLWNVSRLGQALQTLCPAVPLQPVLDEFESAFVGNVQRCFLDRMGLASLGHDEDDVLLDAAYSFLAESRVGYDRFFFDWYGGAASAKRALAGAAAEKYRGERFDRLRALLDARTAIHADRLALPYFQQKQPCSMLIGEIESIWEAIALGDNWSLLDAKVDAVRAMGAVYGRGPSAPPGDRQAAPEQ